MKKLVVDFSALSEYSEDIVKKNSDIKKCQNSLSSEMFSSSEFPFSKAFSSVIYNISRLSSTLNLANGYINNVIEEHMNLQNKLVGNKITTTEVDDSWVKDKYEEYKTLAASIIRGDWGNGDERIRRLTDEGYSYDIAQNMVNNLWFTNDVGVSEETFKFQYLNVFPAAAAVSVDAISENKKDYSNLNKSLGNLKSISYDDTNINIENLIDGQNKDEIKDSINENNSSNDSLSSSVNDTKKTQVDTYNRDVDPKAREQLAKIIYHEVGSSADFATKDEHYYAELNAGAIALNNSQNKSKSSGSTLYEQIYNLTSNTNSDYNDYKDLTLAQLGATQEQQNECLKAADYILSGQYTLDSSMNIQSNLATITSYAQDSEAWDSTITSSGGTTVYFGHEKSLSGQDVFGNSNCIKSPEEGRIRASELMNL